MITPALMRRIRDQFRLEWHGIHGAPHWSRVMHHGVSLARQTNADVDVIRLFAVLHDSQRRHDGEDRAHGKHAADYARLLRDEGVLPLNDERFGLLTAACIDHSDGLVEADLTVQICWDADRLDLGRVGIRPDPRYLCTDEAKKTVRINRAWLWSQGFRGQGQVDHDVLDNFLR
jgi:uncharacterized protein